MKIEVTCIRKRENFEGPLYVHYDTIRIPSTVKQINMEVIRGLYKERVKRIQILRDHWESKNHNNPFIDDQSDYHPIAWSPIITTEALEFICQNF